jgi:hypothetical protein
MKLNYFKFLKFSLIALCLEATISGCQGGGASSLPTRKKMPDLTMEDENLEGTPAFENPVMNKNAGGYAFNAQNIDLDVGGISQGFISVSLPDASTDSATVNLLESLKPFALPLLSGWAQQQRHGVAIDLSAHNGDAVHRSDFMLEQRNGFSFPLVITYDRLSAYRLNTIKHLIAEMPSLKLQSISGN